MRLSAKFASALFITSFALVVSSCAASGYNTDDKDLPNLHQVNDHVFRGGQPSDAGFQRLAGLGVKTIIDLRPDGDGTGHLTQHEKGVAEADGMHYINVPLHEVFEPSADKMSKILNLLLAEGDGPVFVHCKRGADRTGAVIALYRVQHDNWDNKRAQKEADYFGMSWRQFGLKHFVADFHPQAPQLPTIQSASASGVEPSKPGNITPIKPETSR